MKLFLASEAKNPASLKVLDDYVGGLKGKSIAYIPTAGNADGWQSWKKGRSWATVRKLKAQVSLIVLEDYRHSDVSLLLQALKNKDIIWFAGGQCGYLMYWMRRTQLDKHLKNILDSGTVYVGSSAGSMVTGKDLDVVEWYVGENEYGASVIPGLGLVDFDIYPHYNEEHLEEIKKNYKGKKLYLLKDGEEVIVDNDQVKVIGEERIIQND